MTSALLTFFGSLCFFVVLEAWTGPRQNFKMPLWLGLATIIALLVFYISSGAITAQLSARILDTEYEGFFGIVTFVLGLWIASIALQLAANAVRYLQKRETYAIRWFRNPFEEG